MVRGNWKRWAHLGAVALAWAVVLLVAHTAWRVYHASFARLGTQTVIQVAPIPWGLIALVPVSIGLAVFLTWTWERDYGPHRTRRH